MKYERKFYTEHIQLIEELGDSFEDGSGLSDETLKAIISKADELEKEEAKKSPDLEKIKNFHLFANKAILLANELCLDITAETFEKFGKIELCSNSILFSAGFTQECKDRFIELVHKADDFSIFQRDGLIYLNLNYLFC